MAVFLSAEYTSRDAHIGAHSRRSDLEILGYNLVHWMSGTLPWMDNLTDCKYVHTQKNGFMNDVPIFLQRCFGDNDYPSKFYENYLRKILFGLAILGGAFGPPFFYTCILQFEFWKGFYPPPWRRQQTIIPGVLQILSLKKLKSVDSNFYNFTLDGVLNELLCAFFYWSVGSIVHWMSVQQAFKLWLELSLIWDSFIQLNYHWHLPRSPRGHLL